jgi:hypothetical protein
MLSLAQMSPVIWLTLGLAIGVAFGYIITLIIAKRAAADPIPKHPRGMEEKEPYSMRPSVLTQGERSFFEVMRGVLPADYTVLLKVRLGDVVNVTYGAGNRQESHAKACSKSLDFLICNSDLRPVVAIELVEGGSDRDSLRSREFVARVLQKVALPIDYFPLRPSYEESELRAHMAKYVTLHTLGESEDAKVVAMSA